MAADVNLTGEASSLVNALAQSTRAMIDFDLSTVKVTRDIIKFNKDGTALARTITAVDGAGTKLVGTFKKVKNETKFVVTATKAVETNIRQLTITTAAAAQAQTFLARAALSTRPALQVAAEEARRVTKALLDDALAANAVVLAQEGIIAGASTLAGALAAEEKQTRFATIATDNFALALVAEGEAALLAAAAIDALATAEALRKDAALVVQGGQLAAATGGRITAGRPSEGRTVVGDAQKVRIAALKEIGKLELANQSIRRQALQEEIAAFQRLIPLRQQALSLSNFRGDADRRAAAESRISAREETRNIAELNTRRLEALQLSNFRGDADRRAAAVARTASRQEARALEELNTKRREALQLSKFQGDAERRTAAVARNAARDQERTQANLNARRREALQLSNFQGDAERRTAAAARQATSEQERAQARLNARRRAAIERIREQAAATANLANQAKKSNTLIGKTIKLITDLGKIIGIALLVGAVFKLVGAFTEATRAAGELSIKIAEIDTIQTQNALSTSVWAKELRRLSSSFGIDVLVQAEGAYQTLSNQVAQGAEAILFLDAANRLAITGVTDTASAVNLLTSVVNAFKLPVEDAENISAKLFKTVELGRLRIEELGGSFGRVAVPARQLGIDLEELLGALAQTTIQGVKFNEASTLIRNIILKLLRPTDEMRKIFANLGVSTGEALIAQRGFVGTLKAIEEQTGGTSTELGKAFGRIRAITGALIFAGKGADEAAISIQKIREATNSAFREDTNRIIQSTGQQIKIAGEIAKNFFQEQIGGPALKAIVALIKELGGMQNILEVLKSSFLFAADAAKVLGSASVITGIVALGIAIAKLPALLTAAAVAAAPLSVVLGVSLAIVAAVGVLSRVIERAAASSVRILEEQNLAVVKALKEQAEQSRNFARLATAEARKEFKTQTKILLEEIATRRIALLEENKTLAASFKDISRRFKATSSDFTKGVKDQISDSKRQISELKRDAEGAAKDIKKIFAAASKDLFRFDFDRAAFRQQLQLIDNEIARLQGQATLAADSGDLAGFRTASKRIQNLANQRVVVQGKLNSQILDLDLKLEDERRRLRGATTSAERKDAASAIRVLEKDRLSIENATGRQLDLEKQITRALETRRGARTLEEIREATREVQRLRAQQNLVQQSARKTRDARIESLEQVKRIGKQLEQIRREEDARRKSIDEQRLERERLLSLASLTTKEAEAFNRKELDKVKTEADVVQLFERQRDTLEQLISLQRQLGGAGAAQAEAIIQERLDNLRLDAQNAINKLAEEQNAKDITEIEKKFNDEQKNIEKLIAADNRRISLFRQQVKTLNQELVRQSFASRRVGTTTQQIREQIQGPVAFAADNPEADAQFREQLSLIRDNTGKLAKLSEVLLAGRDATTEREFRKLTFQTRDLVRDFSQNIEGRRLAGQEATAIVPQSLINAFTVVASGFRDIQLVVQNQQRRTGSLGAQRAGEFRRRQPVQLGGRQSNVFEELVGITSEPIQTAVEKGFKAAEPTLIRVAQNSGKAFAQGVAKETADVAQRAEELRAQGAAQASTATGKVSVAEQRRQAAVARADKRKKAIADFVQNQERRTAEALKARGITEEQLAETNREILAETKRVGRVDALERFGRGELAGDFAGGPSLNEQSLKDFSENVIPSTTGSFLSLDSVLIGHQALIVEISKSIERELEARRNLAKFIASPTPVTIAPPSVPNLFFAGGGTVSGPGGTDNVPAMLTSGEFVVRKDRAQKFFPQLMAMNFGKLSPPGFQDGGPVNVGGISVTVNESSSPQSTARAVAAEINRGTRRGTIKLRR